MLDDEIAVDEGKAEIKCDDVYAGKGETFEETGRVKAGRSARSTPTRRCLDRRFDVVLAESLDRFSRDQEDREGIAGPFGGPWNPSTIYGNSKRGTGHPEQRALHRSLVWNRLRYVKNLDTGKRVSRYVRCSSHGANPIPPA